MPGHASASVTSKVLDEGEGEGQVGGDEDGAASAQEDLGPRLASIGAGVGFGERALLDASNKRTASVLARSDVECLVISRDV